MVSEASSARENARVRDEASLLELVFPFVASCRDFPEGELAHSLMIIF